MTHVQEDISNIMMIMTGKFVKTVTKPVELVAEN